MFEGRLSTSRAANRPALGAEPDSRRCSRLRSGIGVAEKFDLIRFGLIRPNYVAKLGQIRPIGLGQICLLDRPPLIWPRSD